MAELDQIRLLTQFNRLMNQRLYAASGQLTEVQITADCGAFFKSIIGTLNHILVGDILWLKRFAEHPSSHTALSYIANLQKPTSLNEIRFPTFELLQKERVKIDDLIIDWAAQLTRTDLDSTIAYTNMAGITARKRFGSLILHLLMHQVHHHGQVTTLLSQFGVDYGNADLVEIIKEYGTH